MAAHDDANIGIDFATKRPLTFENGPDIFPIVCTSDMEVLWVLKRAHVEELTTDWSSISEP
jgi:hypothetical protein